MKKNRKKSLGQRLQEWIDIPSILLFSSYLTGPGGDSNEESESRIVEETWKLLGAAEYCLNNQFYEKAENLLKEADHLAKQVESHTGPGERILAAKNNLWETYTRKVAELGDY